MGYNVSSMNDKGHMNTYLRLYFGDLNTFEESPVEIPDAMDQVLVMDANNDLLPDLFGEVPGNPPQRAFWINQNAGTTFQMYVN
jgi:hypothetical protein